MLKKFTLFNLLVLFICCSCSKEPYYFSSTNNSSSYYKKGKEETKNLKSPEAVITAESMITVVPKEETVTFKEDITVATASAAPLNAIVTPKLYNVTAEAVTVENATTVTKKEVRQQKKMLRKEVKKALQEAPATSSSGKSQFVALLIAILIGALGIHRFYLGYTAIGIVQLLTLGGCGIWALIDIIRIATGDLKPKDGDYTEKL